MISYETRRKLNNYKSNLISIDFELIRQYANWIDQSLDRCFAKSIQVLGGFS